MLANYQHEKLSDYWQKFQVYNKVITEFVSLLEGLYCVLLSFISFLRDLKLLNLCNRVTELKNLFFTKSLYNLSET